MAIGNRYNGGGPLQGVVVEGQIDPATGAPVTPSGGSATSPTFVTEAQGTPTAVTRTLVAGEAQTIVLADVNIHGARILNWIADAVYLSNGTTGTPTSGAPSDYIPAAAAGPVPAQFEFAYAPVAGVRAVSATGGTLTVVVW